MKRFTPIIFFFFIVKFSFAQFTICNSNTSATLTDVYFIDAQIGIAVGDSGKILRSIDAGLNWVAVMTNDTVLFRKVSFFDSQNGIAIGSDIYITDDAGLSWQNVTIGFNACTDLQIVNDTTCFVTSVNVSLLKSVDAGATFDTVYNNLTADLDLISFVNDTLGYACDAYGGFATKTLKTTDGGFSWNELHDTSQFPNPTVMEDMVFISEDIGFKAGWYNAHLQKTVDGAKTWAHTITNDTSVSYQIYDLFISKNMPNAYYACGWYGEVYKSTDGGNSWLGLTSGVSSTTSLYGAFFLNENLGWIVGANGTILKTQSGGIGIQENLTATELNLYPNPASAEINISIAQKSRIFEVRIYSMSGVTIIKSNSAESSIHISSLKAGIYVLEVETGKGIARQKFIKE